MQKLSSYIMIFIISFFLVNFTNTAPNPKLINLTENKYNSLIKDYDISIVLFYEDWCAHSKNALKVFKELLKMDKFLDLEITVGFFNTFKSDQFKKFKGFKSVPVINLYFHNNEITYHGLINKDFILKWLIEKTKLSKINEIKTVDELKLILENNYTVFLYFGDNKNKRFNLFSEGYYHYPSNKFLWTKNAYIKQEYSLSKNNFYLFQKDKEVKMYKRAFKKLRYLDWLSINLQMKYSEIFLGFYKNLKTNKNPYLIFVYDKKQNQEELKLFKDNYEIYYENMKGKLCEVSDFGCKEFLKEVPTEFTTFPTVFIITFAQIVKEPLYYVFKENFNYDNLEKFMNDFKAKKLRYETFSEKIDEIYDGDLNEKAYKISRNSFTDYFTENFNKDKIILFYSSNCKDCLVLKKQFEDFTKLILNFESNKKIISFGIFNLSKNSHEVFNPSDESIFIRLYKINNFKNFHDFKVDLTNQNQFQNQLRNFIDDSSTHRIEFEQIIDEM